MGFSLGGAAAAVCAAVAVCLGGGDAASPAADLGGKAVSTTFATFSSPAADHGTEVIVTKAPTPPSI